MKLIINNLNFLKRIKSYFFISIFYLNLNILMYKNVFLYYKINIVYDLVCFILIKRS